MTKHELVEGYKMIEAYNIIIKMSVVLKAVNNIMICNLN